MRRKSDRAPAPFEALPSRQFKAILADPPWSFRSYAAVQSKNPSSNRHVSKHYAVMKTEEIVALPVKELAHPDGCHLFLWVTGPFIPVGIEVMRAWGFKYSGLGFVWVKMKRSYRVDQLKFVPTLESDLHVGLGLTTRKNSELVLLGRRGNCRRNARDVREVIMAPVRAHSQKPDEQYRRIERYCDGPYLELFARMGRPGWINWGTEAPSATEPR